MQGPGQSLCVPSGCVRIPHSRSRTTEIVDIWREISQRGGQEEARGGSMREKTRAA